jgi:hypothetical protein
MNRFRKEKGPREPEASETPSSYRLHTDNTAPIKDAANEERVPLSPSRSGVRNSDIFRDETGSSDDDDAESYEEREMTLQELMYSSSSFYAIVTPGE